MDSTNPGNGGAHASALLMTPAGAYELRAELERLRDAGRDEISQRLREANDFGADSNNDDHGAVRDDQAILEARIASLEDVLARAVVVDPATGGDMAMVGSRVTVEDLGSGKVSSYRIGGAHEAIDRDFVSAASPMGRALMGAATGAVVTVELPSRRSLRMRVVEIVPPSTPMSATG
ncbi:MAG: GreA/GreB family elongation factor [Thermoleophilaceae bacterium]